MGPVGRLEQDGANIIVPLARYIDWMASAERWFFHWERLDQSAFAVFGLMDPLNTKVGAYYVVPGPDMAKLQQRKNRDDGRCLAQILPAKFDCLCQSCRKPHEFAGLCGRAK